MRVSEAPGRAACGLSSPSRHLAMATRGGVRAENLALGRRSAPPPPPPWSCCHVCECEGKSLSAQEIKGARQDGEAEASRFLTSDVAELLSPISRGGG